MLALRLLFPLAASGKRILVVPPLEELFRRHVAKECCVLSVRAVVPLEKLRNLAHDCRGEELLIVVSSSAPELQSLYNIVLLERTPSVQTGGVIVCKDKG